MPNTRTLAIISVAITIAAVSIYIVNELDSKKTNNTQSQTLEDNSKEKYHQAKVTVNDFELLADMAMTREQQEKGLSVKDNLNENEGMLFIYQKEDKYPFWMKGMKFPIDILWLDTAGKVVHIESGLQPCLPEKDCPDYAPKENSLYVLETVAGFAEKHQVAIGTDIDFQLLR